MHHDALSHRMGMLHFTDKKQDDFLCETCWGLMGLSGSILSGSAELTHERTAVVCEPPSGWNYFCSSVPESWTNVNSEFNYFLISSSRNPSVCQERPLLSKSIMLPLQEPHGRGHFCPPKPARLAGKLPRFAFTSWWTCSSQQYVMQYCWKLFSHFLET